MIDTEQKSEKQLEKERKTEELFSYFHKIVLNSESTKQWAQICIVTMFVEVLVYKLISFYVNETKNNFQILNNIYSIFEFCNFRKNKVSQYLLYASFHVFFGVMTLFYSIKYLDLQFCIKYRYLSFKWMDGVFEHLVGYFVWFYMTPSLTIFSGEAFCHDAEDLALANCNNPNSSYPVSLAINGGAIIAIILVIILNSYYHQRDSMNKSDYMGLNDSNFEFKLSLYLTFTFISESVAYKRYPYYVFQIKSILTTFLTIIFYLDCLYRFPFKKYKIQELFMQMMGFVVAFDLAVTIPQHIPSKQHYFPLWFVLFSISFYYMSTSFVQLFCYSKIKVHPGMRVNDYKSFLNVFTESFIDNLAPWDRKSYACGMMDNHFYNCKDKHCFCKKEVVYDSKKKKNVIMKSSRHKKFYFKCFIRRVMEKNMEGTYGTNEWNLFFAEYLFKKFHNIFLANKHLKRAEFMNSSYVRKFKIYRLKQNIYKFVKPDVVGREKDNFVENIISLEKDLVIVKRQMRVILMKSLQFWKEFEKFNQVSLMYFKRELESIADKKFKILKNWTNITNYLQYNPMFNLYYKWYLKDFLNQDTEFNEDDLIALGDINKNVSLKSVELVNDLELDKIAFYNDSGIIHLNLQKEKVGHILDVNVGVLNMTSFSKSDLVGFNITKLMPKPICDYHDKILSNFVKTGGKTYTEDETEGEIRTFMLTRHKILVRVNILFKLIYNMHEGDIQLVGMIREVKSRSDSHNYLLIDEEGIITAATYNFMKITGLSPQYFDLFLFNICLISKEMRYELGAKNAVSIMLQKRKKHEKKKTLNPFESVERPGKEKRTSSKMVEQMKQFNQQALQPKRTISPVDSSEDEDVKSSNEQFSIKMRIPMNIKELLAEFTRRYNTRKMEIESAKKKSGNNLMLENKLRKMKFSKSTGSKLAVAANEIIEALLKNVSKSTMNTFKISGMITKKSFTVLQDYKIIKLSYLNLKRKSYDVSVLKNLINESKKRSMISKSDIMKRSQAEQEQINIRKRMFNRMETNLNKANLMHRSAIEEDKNEYLEVEEEGENQPLNAVKRRATAGDNRSPEKDKDSLSDPVDNMNVYRDSDSLLKVGDDAIGDSGILESRQKGFESESRFLKVVVNGDNGGGSVVGRGGASPHRKNVTVGTGVMDSAFSSYKNDAEKAYRRLQNEQMLLTSYVQVLFKKVENMFRKDEANIPNENLKNGLFIKNVMKFFFYFIILTSLSSLGITKFYFGYQGNKYSLSRSIQVLKYHNASLDTVKRYLTSQMFKGNYFDHSAESSQKEYNAQLTNLGDTIETLMSLTQGDVLRNTLIFDKKSTTDYFNISYDNSSGVSSTKTIDKTYDLAMTSLFSIYLEKISQFQKYSLESLDPNNKAKKMQLKENYLFNYFIEKNWFHYINLFIVRKGNDIYDSKVRENDLLLRLNSVAYGVLLVVYLINFFFIFRLSRIIKPCLTALIVGFNFINDETLDKISNYFKAQLSFLAELDLQENKYDSQSKATFKKMMSLTKSSEKNLKKFNFGNKNRRVNEDSAKGASSFQLSIFFIFLMFFSLILTSIIFFVDYMTYSNMKEFIIAERAIRSEILAMKSASVTLIANYSNILNFNMIKEDLIYQNRFFKESSIYNTPFDTVNKMYNTVFHTNTCEFLKKQGAILDSEMKGCSEAYRNILYNGIKTLREETRSLTEEALGLKLNLKNLTKPEFYEFIKASHYADLSLNILKETVEEFGDQLITTWMIVRLIFHCLSFLLDAFITFTLEKYIGSSIATDYISIKKIYNHFIPNETLNKEKRLRAYFKKAGILNS